MTRIDTVLAVLAISAGALACSKTTPEPDKSEGPAPPPAKVASSSASARVAPAGPDNLAWETPSGWSSVPNANTMRKATFKIPKVPGDTEDAELTVSAAGGGIEMNIKRWAGQFGNAEAKTEPRTANGLKITVVEIKGTFASGGGMMGGETTPKPKYMLLGAVVDGGDRHHFFKMTGPEKTVTAARKDFDAFVASLRAK